MDRLSLKMNAKEQIKGKIGKLFLCGLIVFVITFIVALISVIPYLGKIAYVVLCVIITPAFALSMTNIFLAVSKGRDVVVGDVFRGFDNFWDAFKLTALVSIFTYLWSLLFIVPGIIKGISYSMSMYVMAENPGISAREAINVSKAIMNGRKMDFFVLGLSFIGWGLLCGLTLGIAGIWVVPYMQTTFANFYNSIKN